VADVFETWPADKRDAWVFGYGSLMWNPCFLYVEARRALLRGYHRALCILSIINRGTSEKPGLVLGLDRGGSCSGLAFRIDSDNLAAGKALLWEREMLNGVYRPRVLPVRLVGGERVSALVFVARPDHPRYAGDLNSREAAALVAQGTGAYGTALDYLRNVVRHLDEFGIVDCPLHRVLRLAEATAATATAEGDAP
jgi:glutathione-specific gamma-glutamylcyclotransferase